MKQPNIMWETVMSKTVALLLVLFLLTASCLTMAKPAFTSTQATENTWMTKTPMHFARGCLGVAASAAAAVIVAGALIVHSRKRPTNRSQ
jgi:outer membrane biogenesis lipoprotein LolB